MTKFTTVLAIFIFNHFASTSCFRNSPSAEDTIQQLNDKILETVDGVLISLRIDENFTKPKSVQERFLLHNFIQNVTERHNKKYKEIHKLSKVNVGINKTAYFIFIINEAFEEIIIREHHLNNTSITVANRNNNYRLSVGKGLTVSFTDYNRKISRFITKQVFKLLFPNPKKTYRHSEKKYLKRWVSNMTRNSETRRIYMGQSTTVEEFPFMASLHIAGQFSCAGVIISKDFVITAASCLRAFNIAQRTPHLSLMVRVGSDFTSKYGGLVRIAEMYFHPKYNQNNLANNLVMLKLAKRLNFNKKIRKITFDTKAYKLPENINNILILGWGAKDDKDSFRSTSQAISYAHVDVYNLEECKNVYSRYYVNDKHFCTGYVSKGSGACNNDIGGPAIVSSSLTGIISFGSPFCGRPDAPTVFTKLGYYSQWINNLINDSQKQYLRQSEVDPKKEIVSLTELIGELQVAKHINESMNEILRESNIKDEVELATIAEEKSPNQPDSSLDTESSDETTTLKAHHSLKPVHQINKGKVIHAGKGSYDDDSNNRDETSVEELIEDDLTTERTTATTTRGHLRSTRIGDEFLLEMTISTESESAEKRRSSVNPLPAIVTHKDRAKRIEHSKIEIKMHHDLALRQKGEKKHNNFEIVFWNDGTTQRFPEFRVTKNRRSMYEAVGSTETDSEYSYL